MEQEIIRKDCFWYRPWRDMAATIDQCYFHLTGECHCDENCEMFITDKQADEVMTWFVDECRPFMLKTL